MFELHDERLSAHGVRLWLKPDSNKPRKLKYNLVAAREGGYDTLLTFGGAYSNHLRAVARAGREHGFATIGVVRGEEHLPLNDSLAECVANGMRLSYLDRSAYRRWRLHVGELHRRFGEFYLIPEGGSNALAALGCAEIPQDIPIAYDLVCCPVGTGGTLAGLAAGLWPGSMAEAAKEEASMAEAQTGAGEAAVAGAQRAARRRLAGGPSNALGFAVLKGGDFLAGDVARLQQEAFGEVTPNWRIELGYHCGGYARRDARLDGFLADFQRRHGIELDWIYTGKMMLGIFALAQRGELPHRVVALLTG